MEMSKTFVANGRDVHKALGIQLIYARWIRDALNEAKVGSGEYIIFNRCAGKGRPPIECYMTDIALKSVLKMYMKK